MKRRKFLIASAVTFVGLTRWKLPSAKATMTPARLGKEPISLASYLRANPQLRAAWEKTVEAPWRPYLPTDRELEIQEKRRKRMT